MGCYNQDVPSPPRLSACIVNWNTRDDLRACLTALHSSPYTHGPQEIVVVDNGSADGSAEMVRTDFPDALLIANPGNESYARGTNQALQHATGDLLLLLNPDAQVTTGALDTLADSLTSWPVTGAVAPKLVYPDGTVQASVRGFPTPAAVLWDILKLAHVFSGKGIFGAYRLPAFDYNRAGEAPQPMASCFLIPRAVYLQVGGMDERFPLYFNDVDWCLRAYQAGYRIYYTPEATVRHGYGGTTRRDEARRRVTVWESHRALLRLWQKHYKGRTTAPFLAFMTGVVTLGAWMRTGRWGESLGRGGGDTTPESLHRELERAGRPAGVPVQPADGSGGPDDHRNGGGG